MIPQQAIMDISLSHAELRMLAIIAARPTAQNGWRSATQAQLAEELGLAPKSDGGVRQLIVRLIRKGYIERNAGSGVSMSSYRIHAADPAWRMSDIKRVRPKSPPRRPRDALLDTVMRNTRRARRLGCEGHHTVAEILELFENQGGKCAHSWCRADLHIVGYHLDHRMPLVLGGSNGCDNLQYLCPTCNNKKGRHHPDDFARRQGAVP